MVSTSRAATASSSLTRTRTITLEVLQEFADPPLAQGISWARLDRCDNARLQQSALREVSFRLRSACLNHDKLTFRRRKNLVSGSRIFFTDQDFEAEAAPGQMISHAAGSISLDHGVDAGGFEFALG